MNKERPILFSAPMVRALLAGNKTQTRRLLSAYDEKFLRCAAEAGEISDFLSWGSPEDNDHSYIEDVCRLGKAGDRLWVKETFSAHGAFGTDGRIVYRADIPSGEEPHGLRWTPSIFMPRKASRITLEITAVRMERLQRISEEDAGAEGVTPTRFGCDFASGASGAIDSLSAPAVGMEFPGYGQLTRITPYNRRAYHELWGEINGHDSWDRNPWVWVITFKPAA